jgi:hypothetical protein
MDLSTYRRTAAELAAAAVLELYTDVELLGGGETDTGFFYDFHFPHPIHSHLIEEKMRQIIKEKRPIRTLEMVAFSAAELLKNEGHLARLEELEAEKALVEVIQIGSFYDLSPGPHLKNTAELAAFKIEVESLPEQKMRVVGWCHKSKTELKHFLKVVSNYTDPIKMGEKLLLWKGDIWLSEGLKRRRQFIEILRKEWFTGAYEISGPLDCDRYLLHKSMGKGKVAEIWGEEPNQTLIQITFFNKVEEEVISLLHSIAKTLTILGFDHSTLSKGRETGYLVEDGLGRKQLILEVKKIPQKGSSMVDLTFTVEVEKMMYLLLEKNHLMVMLEN